jgi:hypothetical protein
VLGKIKDWEDDLFISDEEWDEEVSK